MIPHPACTGKCIVASAGLARLQHRGLPLLIVPAPPMSTQTPPAIESDVSAARKRPRGQPGGTAR